MKRILHFFVCLNMVMLIGLSSSNLRAQTQQGFVKSIGRPNKPGVALSGVTIRMQGMVNAVVSSSNGEFQLMAENKKDGDPLVLLSIQKNGYELKDKSLIGRQLVFSSRVPIEIVMVDKNQLEADKKRIEDNAYRVAEENYQKKKEEIEKQIQNNEITAKQYQEELQQLNDKYDQYTALIGEMADRYARTDYDQLDSIDREINICIENGDLDKADSLIHTVFDPETVLERNRAAKEEIRQRIAFAQSIIDKANADKEAILQDIEYAERIIKLCENLAGEYIAQGERAKALECLEKALKISTTLYGEKSQGVETIRQQINNIK